MKRDELLDKLTEDILAYVMHGYIPEREIAKKIKHDQLDERFDDFHTLLDLHFILESSVVDFVRDLPQWVRSIKTQTASVARTHRGGVQGRINWDSTIKRRYTENPKDRSLFVCDHRTEDYDIDENLVLKKLLSVIYNTLEESENYLKENYEWVNQRWPNNQGLISEFKNIFKRDVHIDRIKDPKEYEPTERMLVSAENSRHEIYREASALLKKRRRLHKGDSEEIRAVLNDTAITPDDEATLFELFTLFRFISALEYLRDDKFRLRTISSGAQEVARMESGDKELVLYHDNAARELGIKFLYRREKDRGEISRPEKVEEKTEEIIKNFFRDKEFRASSRRPDVLVLEIRDKDTKEYGFIVVEVKCSMNEKRIREGIKETLEYLAFLKVGEGGEEAFVYEGAEDDWFGNGYNGILVIQDLENRKTAPVEEQETIRILQAKELLDEGRLAGIIGRVM